LTADVSVDLGESRSLDWLLRFDARTDARYEAEYGRERQAALRQIILIGLIFYNMFNFTGLILMPDIPGLSAIGHLLVVTPLSVALAWLIPQIGPNVREALLCQAMIGVVAMPLVLFWVTTAPLGAYTFAESILTILYGNLLLALRFRHALVFTVVVFWGAMLAVATKTGLDPDLHIALPLQYGTGCAFSLYANYRMERQRCTAYLQTLAARSASEAAEAARRRYQGLSHTDALTGLPNRRLLDERAETWFAGPEAAALMMIDLDHFKLFNDSLGHPEGDACLVRVATVFAGFATGPDILAARFGGEEFAFVVRNVGAVEAVRLAGVLIRAVEELGIPHPGRSDGVASVTISVGLTLKPPGLTRNGSAMFREADRALYEAKRRGRNRYALAGDIGVAAA